LATPMVLYTSLWDADWGQYAGVAELVDAGDLKSPALFRRGGAEPASKH
jgi:hypothetical protein